jgi:hypothetical protein
MPTLDTALTFKEMRYITVQISKDLNLSRRVQSNHQSGRRGRRVEHTLPGPKLSTATQQHIPTPTRRTRYLDVAHRLKVLLNEQLGITE